MTDAQTIAKLNAEIARLQMLLELATRALEEAVAALDEQPKVMDMLRGDRP